MSPLRLAAVLGMVAVGSCSTIRGDAGDARNASSPLGVAIVPNEPPGADCELVGNFYTFAGPCGDSFMLEKRSEPAGCVEREVANRGGNVGVVDGWDDRGMWTGRVYRCPISGPVR